MLKHIEVGIVYRFWAEDDEHAVEQLVDTLGLLDNPEGKSAIEFGVNVINDL